MAKEVPVYLFLGFLESGKTKFIQETFEDERFESGERTLLLVLEEGEEEYTPSRFAVRGATVRVLGEKDLTVANFKRIARDSGAERVVVEYNGMLTLDKFFEVMPDGWLIAQVMTFFDARTFLNYNANMRQLVFDKIQYADLVVFNRFKTTDRQEDFHKIVRAVSRRPDIVYEYEGGRAVYDEIEDPLPYDLGADVVEIQDRDFAYFIRDLQEETDKYDGKTVRFRGIAASDRSAKSLFVGRYVMTCCAADVAYNGIVLQGEPPTFKTNDWVTVEGEIRLENHRSYGGVGPVLHVKTMERTEPIPDSDAVATFY